MKFLLSMRYFHHVYDRMAGAGTALLDDLGHVRPETVTAFLRESTALDRTENIWRLDRLDTAYRKLGGRYAEFADLVAGERETLLDEARSDIEDYARLIESWPALIEAART